MRISLVLSSLICSCAAWAPPSSITRGRSYHTPSITGKGVSDSTTSLQVIPSLLAGSIAGAVGVGVAFPLDTIKTKQQTAAVNGDSDSDSEDIFIEPMATDHTDIEFSPDGTMIFKRRTPTVVKAITSESSLWDAMVSIYQTQGIDGFFGGVRSSMMGQGIIKAVAFGVNSATLAYLTTSSHAGGVFGEGMDEHTALLLSAATAGFVTAFLSTPIDRIKVLMQCKDDTCDCTDLDCLKDVLKHEGVFGLCFRGLVPTFFREVPAYTIYFSAYGYLMSQDWSHMVPAASLIFGAISGAACVVPTYPADVIKTILQSSDGSDDENLVEVIKDLYSKQGMSGFWDGLSSRMSRAGLNHAVTFATYDALLHLQ